MLETHDIKILNYAGKWRNSREREKAESLNLSGFSPFIA